MKEIWVFFFYLLKIWGNLLEHDNEKVKIKYCRILQNINVILLNFIHKRIDEEKQTVIFFLLTFTNKFI